MFEIFLDKYFKRSQRLIRTPVFKMKCFAKIVNG